MLQAHGLPLGLAVTIARRARLTITRGDASPVDTKPLYLALQADRSTIPSPSCPTQSSKPAASSSVSNPAGRTRSLRSSASRRQIEFNDVLLGNDGNTVKTGVPSLSGAKVTGEIVRHGRGEKIIVFKQKRRKNYARKRGHRQGFTEVRINDISLG